MKTKEKKFSFRTNSLINQYLKNEVYDKSKFINSALEFYILFLNNPQKLMIELKKRNPDLWKYVNRKKFL